MRCILSIFSSAFLVLVLMSFAQAEEKKRFEPIDFCTQIGFDLQTISKNYCSKQSQPVSLKMFITQVLQQNSKLAINELQAKIAENNKSISESVFDPALGANAGFYKKEQPKTFNFPSASANVISSYGLNDSVYIQKKIPIGGSVTLSWNNVRSDTSDALAPFDPRYDSGLSLSFSQPFLQNFGVQVQYSQIQLNEIEIEKLQIQVQDYINSLISHAALDFFDLILKFEDARILYHSIQRAQFEFDQGQERVRLGSMASSDLFILKENLLQKRNALINAYFQIMKHEMSMHTYLDTNDTLSYRFIPQDEFAFFSDSFPSEELVNTAKAYDPSIKLLQKAIKQNEIQLSVYKNKLLPELNLVSTFDISGTERTFGSSFDHLSGGDFYNWTVGLQFKYQLGNNEANHRYKNQIYTLDQKKIELHQRELEIQQEILSLVEELNKIREELFMRSEITKVAIAKLENEKKKLELGNSVLQFVIQFEEDVEEAEMSGMRTLLNYYKTQIILKQKLGLLYKEFNLK